MIKRYSTQHKFGQNSFMKTIIIFVLSLLLFQTVSARGKVITFGRKETGWMKIISALGREYLVTNSSISLIEENKITKELSHQFKCNDAVVLDNNIALATDSGIKLFQLSDNSLHDYHPDVINKKIIHVTVDALGHLWFCSEFEACFMIDDNDNIITKVTAPVLYSLASTPDSNVWVGTNIGLYKIPAKGTEIFRFAEEGLEGFDLPDNLVERLFADFKSNVWALMPNHVSFIPGKDFEGEIPSYNNIGTKENMIFDIAPLSQSQRSYMFATAQGLIYTADLKADEYNHTGEIHQTIKETAFLVTDDIIDKPASFKNEKVVLIKTVNKDTYFVTSVGLWKIRTAKLIKNIEKNLH